MRTVVKEFRKLETLQKKLKFQPKVHLQPRRRNQLKILITLKLKMMFSQSMESITHQLLKIQESQYLMLEKKENRQMSHPLFQNRKAHTVQAQKSTSEDQQVPTTLT